MGWTMETKSVSDKLGVEAQRRWATFQNAVQNLQLHPQEAASLVKDARFKCLNTKCNQYQILLSCTDRAIFRLDEKARIVRVLQVGC